MPLLHLKDTLPDGDQASIEIGSGCIDMASVLEGRSIRCREVRRRTGHLIGFVDQMRLHESGEIDVAGQNNGGWNYEYYVSNWHRWRGRYLQRGAFTCLAGASGGRDRCHLRRNEARAHEMAVQVGASHVYTDYKVQYSISDADKTVSLKEEIFHKNHYIQILNARYKGKFQFSWDYEESLMDLNVMNLLGEQLHIVIIYTGIGMKKERLVQVRRGLLREESGGHIGIYNTYKRLQLTHADSFAFEICSKYGWGTVIRIQLPAIQIT
ncbi:hypothetical protein LOZ80_03475 [Paenibacillus sp. HWE-109]|uniref:sensor histidine kinase n=1 Tax=Paenibacillus sp. HWE-109 TaxID=1306526 RepID=UPI001EE01B90|nr:hypothetical protein [Paenibacillus sp. HWE-109]UKS28016.1 hypothetical protein LOZ80_03475 [Paenibacillus sp. HWE-109]